MKYDLRALHSTEASFPQCEAQRHLLGTSCRSLNASKQLETDLRDAKRAFEESEEPVACAKCETCDFRALVELLAHWLQPGQPQAPHPPTWRLSPRLHPQWLRVMPQLCRSSSAPPGADQLASTRTGSLDSMTREVQPVKPHNLV